MTGPLPPVGTPWRRPAIPRASPEQPDDRLRVEESSEFLVTWTSVRWDAVGRAVKAEPTLVASPGRPLRKALLAQRLTVSELEAAARQAGIPSLDGVAAIILETDGTLSVISSRDGG